MSVARIHFLVDNDMAVFLGLFTGSLMVLVLFGKFVLFPLLLQSLGLRSSLIISPILVALLTAIVLTMRITIGINAVTFTGFLIFISIAGLLSYLFVLSVEFPSLRVIFHSSENKIRAFSGTIGIIEAALSVAGIILTIAGFFITGMIYTLLLLVPLIAIWLFVAFRMYAGYKDQVVKAAVNEATPRFPNSGRQSEEQVCRAIIIQI